MDIIHAIILGIVEGLTEFLPVSSTGHMILTSHLLKLEETEFLKTFEIFIQLGAILAIVLLYARRFLHDFNIYVKLVIAFIPTGVVGFLAYKVIKTYLFNPVVVAISLIVGGVILVIVDKMLDQRKSCHTDLDNIPNKNAIGIGLFQCIAIIPGVSRAAATIIGGMLNGFDKKQAAEFSFLLAVPTMLAASSYDLLKSYESITQSNVMLLLLGFVMAFISAWFAVKLFVKAIEKYGFRYFGYYRILIGLLFLIFML